MSSPRRKSSPRRDVEEKKSLDLDESEMKSTVPKFTEEFLEKQDRNRYIMDIDEDNHEFEIEQEKNFADVRKLNEMQPGPLTLIRCFQIMVRDEESKSDKWRAKTICTDDKVVVERKLACAFSREILSNFISNFDTTEIQLVFGGQMLRGTPPEKRTEKNMDKRSKFVFDKFVEMLNKFPHGISVQYSFPYDEDDPSKGKEIRRWARTYRKSNSTVENYYQDFHDETFNERIREFTDVTNEQLMDMVLFWYILQCFSFNDVEVDKQMFYAYRNNLLLHKLADVLKKMSDQEAQTYMKQIVDTVDLIPDDEAIPPALWKTLMEDDDEEEDDSKKKKKSSKKKDESDDDSDKDTDDSTSGSGSESGDESGSESESGSGDESGDESGSGDESESGSESESD